MENLENLNAGKITVGWPWRLFIFSLIFFSVFLSAYFGLRFGYRGYLQSQIDKKDQEIAALAQSVPQEEQRTLLKFYNQLSNLQEILGSHVESTKLFNFLQKNTNQKVFYNTLNLSVAEKKISLDGVASSFDVLAQQLEAFKRAPEVERLLMSQADNKDGKVNFRLVLFVKPELF